jgi:hypothetical protein
MTSVGTPRPVLPSPMSCAISVSSLAAIVWDQGVSKPSAPKVRAPARATQPMGAVGTCLLIG